MTALYRKSPPAGQARRLSRRIRPNAPNTGINVVNELPSLSASPHPSVAIRRRKCPFRPAGFPDRKRPENLLLPGKLVSHQEKNGFRTPKGQNLETPSFLGSDPVLATTYDGGTLAQVLPYDDADGQHNGFGSFNSGPYLAPELIPDKICTCVGRRASPHPKEQRIRSRWKIEPPNGLRYLNYHLF